MVNVPPCRCSAPSSNYQTTLATCTDAPTAAPTGAPTVELQVATEISFSSGLTSAQVSTAKSVYYEELTTTFSSSATFSNETIMLIAIARRANSYTATGHGTSSDRSAFVSQLGVSKSSFKTSLASNLQSALGVIATVSDYTSVVQSDAPTNAPTNISDGNDDDDDGLITMENIIMVAMLVAFICIVVMLIWCCVKCCCQNNKYVSNQHPHPHPRPQPPLPGPDLVEVSLRADWNCSACTLNNRGCALYCTACGGAQPVHNSAPPAQWFTARPTHRATDTEIADWFRQQPTAAAGSDWFTGQPAHGATDAKIGDWFRQQPTAAAAPPAQWFATPRGRQMAAMPPWSCAGCTTENPSGAIRCASCGRARVLARATVDHDTPMIQAPVYQQHVGVVVSPAGSDPDARSHRRQTM